MSNSEHRDSEWVRLIREWRPIWDEWNEVMNRLDLAFMTSGVPSQDDLNQERDLRTKLNDIEARMDDCRARIRQRFGL